jgi:RNA polymerase sigma-70 factor, ECF subfamily
VLRADGGGKVRAAGQRERVARVLLAGQTWYPGLAGLLMAVNGGTGALMTVGGEVVAAVGVTVAGGRITEVDLVVNPGKLERARRPRPTPDGDIHKTRAPDRASREHARRRPGR